MATKEELEQRYGSHKQRILLIGPNSEQGSNEAKQLVADLNGKHRALLPEGWRVELQTSGTQEREPPPAGTPAEGAVRSSVQLEQDVARRQQEAQASRAQSGHSEQDTSRRK